VVDTIFDAGGDLYSFSKYLRTKVLGELWPKDLADEASFSPLQEYVVTLVYAAGEGLSKLVAQNPAVPTH
jgi:hypothetical protein